MPSFVPGCSVDVFISYAHADNDDGSIASLNDKLTQKLQRRLGNKATVWFDTRIRAGDEIREEIQATLQNTPVFVAVISPAYLESEFCIRHELDWFQNHPGTVVQLVKNRLDQYQPIPVRDAKWVRLYDEADDRPLTGRALETVLEEVAGAVADKLRKLWEERPKVYVAQLREERFKHAWKAMKDRIHDDGKAILPKGLLPLHVDEEVIRGYLEAAAVSIHLSGVSDDALAYGQLDIARTIGKPLIVLSKPPTDDQLPDIIAKVQNTLDADRKPAVYFIYDHYSDRQLATNLAEFLEEKTGCQVVAPQGGEKYHKQRLRASDGVLLFRSRAPEDWFKSQQQSLLQAAALRESVGVPEAWYTTRKPNGHPVGVERRQGSRQEWIIERTGDPNIEDLEPFVAALLTRLKAGEGRSA